MKKIENRQNIYWSQIYILRHSIQLNTFSTEIKLFNVLILFKLETIIYSFHKGNWILCWVYRNTLNVKMPADDWPSDMKFCYRIFLVMFLTGPQLWMVSGQVVPASSSGVHFTLCKCDNAPLCSSTPALKSFLVRSQGQCVVECQSGRQQPPCVAVNYRVTSDGTQYCDMFYVKPTYFENIQGCQYIQVLWAVANVVWCSCGQ